MPLFEAYGGRLAIEATMEPPVTVSRNQGSKIPDGPRLTGRRASIGLRGDAGRGTPDIDRREEKRIKRYKRDRTGSALVSMEVGIRAELGSAEMRMLVPGCWSSKGLLRAVRGHPWAGQFPPGRRIPSRARPSAFLHVFPCGGILFDAFPHLT